MAGPRIPLLRRFQPPVLFSLPFHLPLACTHFTGRSARCSPSPSSAACPETPQPTWHPACSVSPADGILAGEPIAKGQPWCPHHAGCDGAVSVPYLQAEGEGNFSMGRLGGFPSWHMRKGPGWWGPTPHCPLNSVLLQQRDDLGVLWRCRAAFCRVLALLPLPGAAGARSTHTHAHTPRDRAGSR